MTKELLVEAQGEMRKQSRLKKFSKIPLKNMQTGNLLLPPTRFGFLPVGRIFIVMKSWPDVMQDQRWCVGRLRLNIRYPEEFLTYPYVVS